MNSVSHIDALMAGAAAVALTVILFVAHTLGEATGTGLYLSGALL